LIFQLIVYHYFGCKTSASLGHGLADASQQYNWFIEYLERANETCEWIVVIMNQPSYSETWDGGPYGGKERYSSFNRSK